MAFYKPGNRLSLDIKSVSDRSWTSSLQNGKKEISIVYKPASMVFCYNSLNRPRWPLWFLLSPESSAVWSCIRFTLGLIARTGLTWPKGIACGRKYKKADWLYRDKCTLYIYVHMWNTGWFLLLLYPRLGLLSTSLNQESQLIKRWRLDY